MRDALGVDEKSASTEHKDSCDTQCKEFQHFARQILPILKAFLKKVASSMNSYSQGITDSKNYINLLTCYEELNLANYVDGVDSKMVFGNRQN